MIFTINQYKGSIRFINQLNIELKVSKNLIGFIGAWTLTWTPHTVIILVGFFGYGHLLTVSFPLILINSYFIIIMKDNLYTAIWCDAPFSSHQIGHLCGSLRLRPESTENLEGNIAPSSSSPNGDEFVGSFF